MTRPASLESSENLSDSAFHSPTDAFAARHIGTSNPLLLREMLKATGFDTLDELINAAVPEAIRSRQPLNLPAALSEFEALGLLQSIAKKNQVFRSHIGQGYYGTITPPVILRNILENPGWYTAYTPYQAEISQGRMEALVNYQTMIVELTKMEIANASLLDEGTAAAEAMHLTYAAKGGADRKKLFVSDQCFAQTTEVVRTRASALDIEVVVGNVAEFVWSAEYFAALVQYPAANGEIADFEAFAKQAHDNGALLIVAADILALTLLRPPGEFGADVAVGSTQRFGVPMGFGGPHAAYMATREELKRLMPGRLIGVSKDSHGNPGYRLSLQTREQHIRRDKATSNICTAQVLLAVIASMYAVYHGPNGLRSIASRVVRCTRALASGLRQLGWTVSPEVPFDTITVDLGDVSSAKIAELAAAQQVNLRVIDGKTVGISVDETTRDLSDLLQIFNGGKPFTLDIEGLFAQANAEFPAAHARTSDFLTHPVFSRYHSETELLRYLKRLENRDLTLTNSMIPLGSCTMKLNAAAEMIPVTWPEFGQIHPFAPKEQWTGYLEMIQGLESWLAEITGLPAVSLQPNAGSQGEYAGLLLIHAWHAARKQTERDVCLIPLSAHGTNPASAVMAGFRVVPVTCDTDGNIDIANLKAKLAENEGKVGALMVTYPSTHGVFETTISEICSLVHEAGALVYMDGANMNAQVGLCRPGDIGVDVCHLNLHKTFCIPHGGGGPGVGPIAATAELGKFMPGHPAVKTGGSEAIGPVSAAPWGSASILVISWMYIAMMGPDGLTHATKMAILNANYIASKLSDAFPVLYRGNKGLVAHECILDVREWKQRAGVEVEDIAKRLMDYGFHAPTMSWPVPGTLMVEPTESESKAELDRFCEAMLTIHGELLAIESGKLDRKDNPLKNAPHTAVSVMADNWSHGYTREQAAFPAPWLRESKYWPPVGRVDNVYGDRNLYCTCVPMDA